MKALILNLKNKDIVILYSTKEELEEKLKPFVEKGEGSFKPSNMGLKVV
jgi:hypothetical protein